MIGSEAMLMLNFNLFACPLAHFSDYDSGKLTGKRDTYVTLSMPPSAAGTGQIELVERLLELDAECSQADKNQWTPLTYAAAGGHANCVRALLDAGASAGDVDTYGRTALHWAAERGWADVVTLLVPAMALEGRDVGLLVSAQIQSDYTPLLQSDVHKVEHGKGVLPISFMAYRVILCASALPSLCCAC